MLRTYYYKNLFTYVCNQAVGIIILLIYSYILLKYLDSLSFLPLVISVIFFSLQSTKSYLLYFPSTYLNFSSTGISFNKYKQEIKFIEWEDIKRIELKIKNEWMLNMLIEKNDGEVVRLILSEKWLLSFGRKFCIKHNFLKIISIANINPILRKKLDSEQVQDFYEYCNISMT